MEKMPSENVEGADNQQERLVNFIEVHKNPQRPHADAPPKAEKDIVRTAWRHAETSRNISSQSALIRVMFYPRISAIV
ncbi:MAG: hypothetical protein HYV67_03710 [Candidatus Taylorbacteria bacterium]|nr:hypothetical protein [Candidatus Taylorbacteria bacterium]